MEQGNSSQKVLFVCSGNTCRSPMAAALFNHCCRVSTTDSELVGDERQCSGWIAESAGLAAAAGQPASPFAQAALQMDFGLDLSGHRSRPVTRDILEKARWILAMTPAQRDELRWIYPKMTARIMTIGEMAGEPGLSITDPYGGGLGGYRDTAANLADLVCKIIDNLMI